MSVLVGGFSQELNSFVPGVTDLEWMRASGAVLSGDEVLSEKAGVGVELTAIRDLAAQESIGLIPTAYGYAGAGPRVADELYGYFRDRILKGARTRAGEIDGVMLVLHGAMSSESIDDTEGDLVRELRAVLGERVPIAVTHDLHANVTAAMARSVDVLVGYRTCPHVDRYETGERAMRLLIDAMRGRVRPVTAYRKLPMITSAEPHDTTRPPMSDVMAFARELEREPGILSMSVFASQPWMDVEELGWSVLAMSGGDRAIGQDAADRLARSIWDRRERFRVRRVPIAEALTTGLARRRAPIVLADGADSTTAGAHGDGNLLLRELIGQDYGASSMLVVTDPNAVARAFTAGVGGELSTPVGGTLTPAFFSPVDVIGRVTRLSEGRYMTDSLQREWDAGRVAVIQVSRVQVVLTERKAPQLDTSIFRHAGLDPRSVDMVQVKSAGAYKDAYGKFASELIDLDTTGPCDSELTRLPFKRIPRPMWPFDAPVLPWIHGCGQPPS